MGGGDDGEGNGAGGGSDDDDDEGATPVGEIRLVPADLADVVDGIVVVFREKAQKSGDRKIFGRAVAVSPSDWVNVLGDDVENVRFILEVGQDSWEEMTSRQREAAIDHLLCSCWCEIDDESGKISCRIVKPDIMAYQENVDRYGMWFPAPAADEPEAESSDDE